VAKIQFRLPDEQRDRWDDFVEDNGHVETRTALIKLAVEEHIADAGNSGGDTLNDAALDDLHHRLNDLEESIDQTKTKVQAHRTEAVDIDEIDDIMQQLIEEVIVRLGDADDAEVVEDADYSVRTVTDAGDFSVMAEEAGLNPSTRFALGDVDAAADFFEEHVDEGTDNEEDAEHDDES